MIQIDIDKIGVRAPPEPSGLQPPPAPPQSRLVSDEVVPAACNEILPGSARKPSTAGSEEVSTSGSITAFQSSSISRPTNPLDDDTAVAINKDASTRTDPLTDDQNSFFSAAERDIQSTTTSTATNKNCHDVMDESVDGSFPVRSTDISDNNVGRINCPSLMVTTTPEDMTDEPSSHTPLVETAAALTTQDASVGGNGSSTVEAAATNPPTVDQGDANISSEETPSHSSQQLQQAEPSVPACDDDQEDGTGDNNTVIFDHDAVVTQQGMSAQFPFGPRNPQDDNDEGDQRLDDVFVPLERSEERDEESKLMGRLDATITRAEERQLMQRLDWSIGRLEEKALLARLKEKIRDAQDSEPNQRLYSKVTDVFVVGEKNQQPAKTGSIQEHERWEMPRRRKSQQGTSEDSLNAEVDFTSPDVKSEEIDTNEDTGIAPSRIRTEPSSSSSTTLSRVQNVDDLKLSCLRSRLPKWVPPDLDVDSKRDSTTKDFLFTPDQFYSCVFKEFEAYIPRTHNRYWAASIVDDSPNSGLHDSYLLQARGQPEMLAKLKEKAESFVRERIWDTNVDRVLDDKDSIVVGLDVMGPDLGLRWPPSPMLERGRAHRHKGLWIREILDGGGVAIALGGRTIAKCGGCVLLEINGCQVENHEDFIARTNELTQDHGGGAIKIILCFSKYTDLKGVHKSRNLKIRMMDGRPFADEEYEQRRLALMSKTIAKLPNRQAASDVRIDATNERLLNRLEDQVSTGEFADKETLEKENKALAILDSGDDHGNGNDNSDGDEESHESRDNLRSRRDVVHSSTSNDLSTNPRNERYLHFMEKYKALIVLDYRATGIPTKSVCSSMWTQHKRCFGDDAKCDESCKCISSLPKLNLKVVGDYVKKKERRNVEAESILQVRTSGIFDHFAPRFIPLLKKEYPTETPTRLVQRLVDMWSLHQRSPMYGVHCTRTCSCVDDWEQFFGEGDIDKALEFHSRGQAKHRNPRHQSSAGTQMSTEHAPTTIPKKKDLLTKYTRKISLLSTNGQAPNERLIPSSTSRRENVHNSDGPTLSTQTHSSTRSFQVKIDTSVPIGGYFRTKRGPSGGSKCIVFSVFRSGQLIIDSRIAVGTIVLGVVVGGIFHKLTNHSELFDLYESAKRRRINSLSVIFVNRDSQSNRSSADDWDSNGNWVGPADDGWTGGAHVSSRELNPHGDRPLIAQHTSKCATVSSPCQKAVIDAVESQSCKELHDVLRSTSEKDSESVISVLASQYQHVKRKISEMDNTLAHKEDEFAKKHRKDLEAKRNILNIYINSALIIEKAISLSDWSEIVIRVDQIDLAMNITSSYFQGLSNVLNGTLISMPPRVVVVC